MKYMISACLMGENCKYNGGNNRKEALLSFMRDKDFICVCPERLGGLSTPRSSCEIVGDRIISEAHEDVSTQFLQGAYKALQIALEQKIDCVITQPRSPSCGMGRIYDGTFQGRLIDGNGWFVKELLNNHILVIDYEQFYENTIKKLETMEESI